MTPRQLHCLEFIRERLVQTGLAPTYPEIAEAIGTASRGGAHDAVQILIRDGHLVKTGAGSRNIRLPGAVLAAVPREALQAELDRRDRVLVCGDCERRADDPAVRACTDTHCPIRQREAA